MSTVQTSGGIAGLNIAGKDFIDAMGNILFSTGGGSGGGTAANIASLANYVIYKQAGIYYSIDGLTSTVAFSNADPTTVIQQSANALSGIGGLIYIRPGTFAPLIFTIVVPYGVSIIGAGPNATFLQQGPNLASGTDMFSLPHGSGHNTIKGMDLDGNFANQSGGISASICGFNLQGANQVTFEDLNIHDFTWEGIYSGNDASTFLYGNRLYITKCHRNGLGFVNTQHAWFENITTTYCGNNGIDFETNSAGASVSDITMVNLESAYHTGAFTGINGGSAVYLSSYAYKGSGNMTFINPNLHDCSFLGAAVGIAFAAGAPAGGLKNVKVIGGRIYNCQSGVNFSGNQQGHQFFGVDSYSNLANGFQVNGVGNNGYLLADIKFWGCNAYNNVNYGFFFNGNSTNIPQRLYAHGCTAYDDQATPTQNYGMSMAAYVSPDSCLDACSAFGNVSGQIIDYGTVGRILNSQGNYQAAGSLSVTASPMTYTCGGRPVIIYIKGGTVSSITVDGQLAASASPATICLGPRQVMVLTYSAAPTATITVM
jgi:hypothetical protein